MASRPLVSVLTPTYQAGDTLRRAQPHPSRHPSGIVGDQGSFAHLVAREMRARLGWSCELELAHQTSFHEPRIRINTDPAAARHPDRSLARFWDQLARAVTSHSLYG